MITISFTEQELQQLQGLMDAGVRHSGLAAALPAAILAQKIQAAAERARSDSNVVPMDKAG